MVSVMRNTSSCNQSENDECSKSKLSLCYLERKTNLNFEHWDAEIASIKAIIDTLEEKINLLNAKLNKERYRRKSFIDEHRLARNEEEGNEPKGVQLHFLHFVFNTVFLIYFFTKKN